MGKVYAGVDIGGTNTKLAIVDARGGIIARRTISTLPDGEMAGLFLRAREALAAMIEKRHRLVAAGVGCAGLVDPDRGWLHSSANLPLWNNVPVARIARRTLGVYTIIDNDANAAAWGEYRCGVGRGARLVICVTLGTGVGGGVVTDGRILRGALSFAGEVGHMTVSPRGPLCKCGNRGCLEAFVGADALVASALRFARRDGQRVPRKLSRADRARLDPKRIAVAAREGDRAAREAFDRAALYLGIAFASLVNVLNPDMIVVSGGVAGGFDLMKKRIRDVVRERAFPESAAAVKITRGRLGNNAATVGAALLAKEAFVKKESRR